MKRFLSFIAAILLAAGVAWAGVDTAQPTLEGKGVLAEVDEAGGAGESFVGVLVFFEADDTAAYGGPTGATLDTGTEACAVHGLSCFDAYIVDPAGASGDELTDSTCAADQTDNVLALAICY